MQERDPFSIGADARDVIDELYSGMATAFEGRGDVIDGKTDVMNPGTALCDEFGDGRRRIFCLEKLDERVAGAEAGDAGTVGVIEGFFGESEQVAIKW